LEKDVKGMPEEAEGGRKGTTTGDMSTDLAVKRTDMATERTDMALARTVMASDRTLMSWVRTSLSLMSFGFTIYKFLMYMMQSQGSPAARLTDPDGPRQLGIIMVCMSILCIVLGMIEYHGMFRRFSNQHHQKLWGTSFIIAALTAILGLLLLVAVIVGQ
jgi:putative membrane protein